MAKFESNDFIKQLTVNWSSRPCPMCGKGPWNVQDSTFQLTEFNEGNLVLGGPVIPVIPITCGNCGYVALVNAIVSGVHKPGKPPAEEKAK
ncbi:hypothetical protein AGMMS50256_24300 [Betaproteobacteria bacterium]|nr:hypothetical protein AGMMS50256_24300 [Betaproteobacteria bacterium]